jgi:hypothetical protein
MPVRECCPCQSGQRIDDETVLWGDLFSAVLHSTRVRQSRRYCLLHLSIGLPIGGEEQSADRNATLQGRNPLVSPVTARTGLRFLTPHPLCQASEWHNYFRRPSHPRVHEESRTRTQLPDLYSALPRDGHDDSR